MPATTRLFAAKNSHPKALCLSLLCSVFAFGPTSLRVKSSRCSTVVSRLGRLLNASRFASCRSHTDTVPRLPLPLLRLLLTRRTRKPPNSLLRSNSSCRLRAPPPTTHSDPLSALLDSTLGFCRVRCVNFWRCASLVSFADGSPHHVGHKLFEDHAAGLESISAAGVQRDDNADIDCSHELGYHCGL